jgi:glucose-1-phosphatase
MRRRQEGLKGSGIKVVFFDIGNVLLRFDSGVWFAGFHKLLGRHPVRLVRLAVFGNIADRVERGKLSGREVYALLRKELDFAGSFLEFRRLWCGHFVLESETARLLRRVARRRKVFFLSNTNHLRYEFIRKRYAFVRHASGAVLSHRLGLRKPEPAIYRAALRRAGVRAGEAFFVDDLAENVEAARKVGIVSWRYTGAEALERRLTELNLL